MMVAEKSPDVTEAKKSEAELIVEQVNDFKQINVRHVEKTLFLLERFPFMKLNMLDYEKHADELQRSAIEGETARRLSPEEYYANKTANAVILAEKQRWIYQEYLLITQHIERANGLNADPESRKAVFYRHLKGFTYKETCLFFGSNTKSRTIDRKLKYGVKSIANQLRIWGMLERDWDF